MVENLENKEQEFLNFIEALKAKDLNPETTKKYILTIKGYLDKIFENCDSEISREEIFNDWLKTYYEETSKRPVFGQKITFNFSQYDACKTLLKLEKKNKGAFLNLLREAKEKEATNSKEDLYITLNMKEQILRTLRSAVRSENDSRKKIARAQNKGTKLPPFEVDVVSNIRCMKEDLEKIIKSQLIKSVQESVAFLEEYGFIDEYISEANRSLENLHLEGLKHVKRNPLADVKYDENHQPMKYDENGNIIKYHRKEDFEVDFYDENGVPIIFDDIGDPMTVDAQGRKVKYDKNGNLVRSKNTGNFDEYDEDIGVIDTFDTKYLEKFSPEALLLLDTTWKSRYFLELVELNDAIFTIKFLDLTENLIGEDAESINEIDDKKIKEALRRILAVKMASNYKYSLNHKIKLQYSNYVKATGMKKTGTLLEDIESQNKALEGVCSAGTDVSWQECVIIDKLRRKQLDVKSWGISGEKVIEKDDGRKEKCYIIAIDSPDFRGTLVMSMEEALFREYYGGQTLEIQEYTTPINEEYSNVMSLLYLPNKQSFKSYIEQKYKQNPSDKFLSHLAVNFAGSKKINNVTPQNPEDVVPEF